MKRVAFGLLGVGLVFWVANWISIDTDKGWNPMCTILGCMATGGGMALIIAGSKVRGR